MKKLLISFFVVLGILMSANQVYAAPDFSVSCGTTTCTPGTITGFFPATETWYPTKTFSQTIQLTNTSVNTQAIKARPERRDEVTLEGTDLAQSIQFTIVRSSDGVTVWDGSLYAFYGTGGVDLMSSLAVGSSETFTFTGYMYQDAGNEYQERKTWFDMYIETVTEMTPTPTPNPNCTIKAADVPGPLSLSQVAGSNSEVKVTWGKSTGATGYEITWGDDLNANNKGSKSVGDTGETTVGGLNLDTTRYYFHVRSIKDCAKSDWNGTRSIGTGTDLLSNSSSSLSQQNLTGRFAPFASGQIQGATTISPSVTPGATPTPEGKVKGASTVSCQCIWWQVLLGEALVLLAYLWLVAKDMTNKRNHVASGVIAALAYAIFLLVNKCLSKTFFIMVTSGSIFCRFFWALDLLVLVSSILLVTKLKKKETD